MALQHLIVHKLLRKANSEPSELRLCEEEWPLDESRISCFREVKQATLARAGKEYGSLTESHDGYQLIKQLVAEDLNFVEFSHKYCSLFKQHLDESEVSLDEHLLFATETLEKDHILHCYFLAQDTHYFVDNDLQLSASTALNTQPKFGFQVKLNELLSEDSEQQQRAVTLLRARGDKACNDLLHRSIGFGDKKDIASETESLLQSVNQYTRSLPEEIAHFAKREVVNYCLEQEKTGDPVVIRDLSHSLAQQIDENQASFSKNSSEPYTPPPRFDNFVLENNQDIKNEIIADKNKLKNFVRISGRNEQLSMSFSSSCLGDSVVYDPNTDSLTVTAIPSSLKSRLIKLIQQ